MVPISICCFCGVKLRKELGPYPEHVRVLIWPSKSLVVGQMEMTGNLSSLWAFRSPLPSQTSRFFFQFVSFKERGQRGWAGARQAFQSVALHSPTALAAIAAIAAGGGLVSRSPWVKWTTSFAL